MQIKAIAKYPFPPKGTGAVRRLAQLSAGKGMKAQGLSHSAGEVQSGTATLENRLILATSNVSPAVSLWDT